MKKWVISLILIGGMGAGMAEAQSGFRQQQERYPRVREARDEASDSLRAMFARQALPFPCPYIFLRVFKEEGELEMWGKAQAADTFRLVRTYPICSMSGDPCPKREQGDLQVPEGFYHISYFNPYSHFFLSLKVNYPNLSDRRQASRGRSPGGDIFIHGNCVSIGCMAMTTPLIKEIYWACVQAQEAGNRIYVHAFPHRLTAERWERDQQQYAEQTDCLSVWAALRKAYCYFDRHRQIPSLRLNQAGYYEVLE